MSKEVLLVVGSVSNEKGVPAGVIFEALELALATATKKTFRGRGRPARRRSIVITAATRLLRRWHVVADEDTWTPPPRSPSRTSRSRSRARRSARSSKKRSNPSSFGRIAAQTAKQVIVQKVREAERAQVVDAYREKVGEIISGTVKKVTRDTSIVDLGNNAEALLARDQIIPRETFRVGTRVRALLKEIRTENRGPQTGPVAYRAGSTDRAVPIEVPEIAEQLIDVMAAARDPGSRAKIAVRSKDKRIDPQGARIGARSARSGGIRRDRWRAGGHRPVGRQPGAICDQRHGSGRGGGDHRRRGYHSHGYRRRRGQSGAGYRPQWPERPSGQPVDRLDPECDDRGGYPGQATGRDRGYPAALRRQLDVSTRNWPGTGGRELPRPLEEIAYVPMEEMLRASTASDEDIVNELRPLARIAC